MTKADDLNYGRHWNGSIDSTRRYYKPRHHNNGNCHHWWPDRRFSPPEGWSRNKPETHAPFRMLKREPWKVKSPKGFRPGMFVMFKYPDLEEREGWGHPDLFTFMLISRYDFPGIGTGIDNGAQVAWRIKDCGNGSEYRVPEWRLALTIPQNKFTTLTGAMTCGIRISG